MDRKATVVFFLAIATINAGVLPAPKVLEGPSSKTTIIGPDGSKISSFAPGGKILLDENAGPVLQGAPEVVAVAGIAQPIPVVPSDVTEKVIPVVEEDSDDNAVAVEVPVENGEAVDLARSATTENVTQIEATTITVPISTVDISQQSQTETPVILESSTDSPVVEKLTDTPFNVVPLVKGEPLAAEAAESQPLVGYINGSPFYVPQLKGIDGEYVPGNLFEQEILGW